MSPLRITDLCIFGIFGLVLLLIYIAIAQDLWRESRWSHYYTKEPEEWGRLVDWEREQWL